MGRLLISVGVFALAIGAWCGFTGAMAREMKTRAQIVTVATGYDPASIRRGPWLKCPRGQWAYEARSYDGRYRFEFCVVPKF